MKNFFPVGPTIDEMQRANDAKNEEPKKKVQPKPEHDPECVICQNEGPRENMPGGKHQHVYEGHE